MGKKPIKQWSLVNLAKTIHRSVEQNCPNGAGAARAAAVIGTNGRRVVTATCQSGFAGTLQCDASPKPQQMQEQLTISNESIHEAVSAWRKIGDPDVLAFGNDDYRLVSVLQDRGSRESEKVRETVDGLSVGSVW